MDYSHFAVLLLIVGISLLVAEIFIPSGGLILTGAVLALAGSAWCAWTAWWGTSPSAWWIYVCSVVVLIPAATAAALYIFPRTSLGRRILLEGPAPEEVAAYSEERAHLASLVGQTGKTLTLLNPGGLSLIAGERIHCESEGMVIEPGQEVVVVGVKGNRVVVRLSPQGEPPPEDLPGDVEDRGKPPLDFDLSQS